MATVRAAIIGCGRRDDKLNTGCGVSWQHGKAYSGLDEAELVALCDLIPARAEALREAHGTGEERVYTDFREMLRVEQPDLVSICTWPMHHPRMVEACAEAGIRAVHCEKPMALTWGEAKQMAAVCEQAGTQLTFNHQRRFGPTFRKVREIVQGGKLGEVIRIEAFTGNLFDWGTHWFDMMLFYNGDVPGEWVIGQIDLRGSHSIFGAPLEGQGLAMVGFANGVEGLMFTGDKIRRDLAFRVIGSEAILEMAGRGQIRVAGKGRSGWKAVKTDEQLHGAEFFALALKDVIAALEAGREPELSARKALQATELIFATYESSRRGGRVDLPLDVEDSALAARLAAGGTR